MPDRRWTAAALTTNLIDKMDNLALEAAESPVATTDPAPYAGRRSGGLKLGFLTNVPFTDEESGAADGLAEAIETFKYAESVGFDSGWARQRHFDNYISSPLVLLAAIAQHTSRIRLGTGVLTVSYEDPIRLTEDASTVDLLSGGRLELGMAAGNTRFDAVFGGERLEGREEGHDRIRRFREALAGNTLPIRDPDATPDLPEFRARPRSPELDQRLWYGSGSAESAARTGSLGLGLLLSTLNHNPTSESFEESQRDNIVAYLDAFDHPVNQPRVCLSRLFMPAINAASARAIRRVRSHPPGRGSGRAAAAGGARAQDAAAGDEPRQRASGPSPTVCRTTSSSARSTTVIRTACSRPHMPTPGLSSPTR